MGEEKVGFFRRLVRGLSKTRTALSRELIPFSAGFPALTMIFMRR